MKNGPFEEARPAVAGLLPEICSMIFDDLQETRLQTTRSNQNLRLSMQAGVNPEVLIMDIMLFIEETYRQHYAR